MKKIYKAIILTFTFSVYGGFSKPAVATKESPSWNNICSELTQDIRCKGYKNPESISLKKRPGYKVTCVGAPISLRSKRCKVLIDTSSITIFYKSEQAKDNTSSLNIPFSQILDYSYPDFSIVTNLGYFGLLRSTNRLGVIEIKYKASQTKLADISISFRNNKKDLFALVKEIHELTNFDQLTYQDNVSPIYQYVDQSFESKADLEKKIKDEHCVACNLEGVNLSNSRLPEVMLDRVNLSNSDLTGTNLEGASLWRANLENAILKNVDWSSSNSIRTNLKQAYLVNANLAGANLAGANLGRANLKGANLQGADLSVTAPSALIIFGQQKVKLSTHLAGTNLEDANLSEANLIRANLQFSNLKNANLRQANLSRANFDNANLENAIFDEVILKKTSFINANLLNAKINPMALSNSLLCNTVLPDGTISQKNCKKK